MGIIMLDMGQIWPVFCTEQFVSYEELKKIFKA